MTFTPEQVVLAQSYTPYRYLDPERRASAPFETLEAIATDLHVRRRGQTLRVVDHQVAWEFGEGQQRATVSVFVISKAGDQLDYFVVLTGGEDAAAVMEALKATKTVRKAA